MEKGDLNNLSLPIFPQVGILLLDSYMGKIMRLRTFFGIYSSNMFFYFLDLSLMAKEIKARINKWDSVHLADFAQQRNSLTKSKESRITKNT